MRLLHRNATESTVAHYSQLVFGIWILRAVFLPLENATCLPIDFCSPTGVLILLPDNWLNWLWDKEVLFLMRATILVASALCFLGKAPRTGGTLVCLLGTVEQSLVRSFGLMKHAEISLLLATYVLTAFAFTGYVKTKKQNETTKSKEEPNPYAACLVTVAFLLTLTYSMVGVTRICEGGFEVFKSDTILWTILNISAEPWFFDLGLGEKILEWPWLMKTARIGFPIVTVCEIIAPWCLVSRKFRFVVVPILASMHILVFLLTHLLFLENLLLLAFLLEFRYQESTAEAPTKTKIRGPIGLGKRQQARSPASRPSRISS